MSQVQQSGGPDMLVAALWWARKRVPVFPLYEAVGLCCACGSPDCYLDADGEVHGSPGKHPRAPNGLDAATTDEQQIHRWWKQWPTAAIGGVVARAGAWVLDIDVKSGRDGFETLSQWEETHGALPTTFTVRTGSGGEHRWFRMPSERLLKNRADVLPGLDVRAERGYVVLPPSPHVSGNFYEVVDPKAPVVEAPPALLDLVTRKRVRALPALPVAAPPTSPGHHNRARLVAWCQVVARSFSSLTPGSRNDTINQRLFEVGGRLHNGGLTPEDVAHLFVDPVVHAEQPADLVLRALVAGAAAPLEMLPERAASSLSNATVHSSVRAVAVPLADEPPDGEETDDSVSVDDLARLPHTDLGNAKRMQRLFGGDVHWCEERRLWLTWNGRHWDWDEARCVHGWTQDMVERLVDEAQHLEGQLEALKSLGTEAEAEAKLAKRVKQAWGHAKASQASGRISAAMSECRAIRGIPVTTKVLDQQQWLLATANGTLDLQTGAFRAPRRADLGTRALDVAHDPTARAPTWERVIARVLPDADVRGLVQRAFGYALTGNNGEQKWFLLTGKGSNGKSTVLDAFRHLMGPYATLLPARVLEVQKFDQHPTELMGLLGARAAVGSEPRKGSKWDAERIKSLTGDATMTARRMRENEIEFRCTAKLFVSANDLPQTDDLGHGFWRRIIVVPFNETISPDEADPMLQSKLEAEAAGLLNWALAGLRDWLDMGLAVPSACMAKANEYRAEQDEVKRFVEEMCVVGPHESQNGKELYAVFRKWVQDEGIPGHPMHRVMFAKRLIALGYPSAEGSRRVAIHHYLRLASEAERAFELAAAAQNAEDESGRYGRD